MTNEEVAKACKKFTDYLNANGVNVHGHLLQYDDYVTWRGDPDELSKCVLAVAADIRGFTLVPRS